MVQLQKQGSSICLPSTVYRTIELEDGWNGKIISNQTLFSEHILLARSKHIHSPSR